MGQTSSGSSSGSTQGQNVTERFGELLTPVGDWFVDQFVFLGSNAEPVHRTGRVTSRSLVGQAAILAVFEIPSSGARFAALVTFDPRHDQYDLALVDANSDMGLGLMVSKPENRRAPIDVRVRFGKSATVIREWTVVQNEASLGGSATDVIIAVLPVAAAEEGLTEGASAAGVSMRILEILVSPDRWILQFFFTGSRGEFLAEELVCTRIQPGCQPLLGCELGCPALVGCAAGCAGLQPPNGMPVGQAPIMGQTQITGQAQCGCTAQGHAQLIGQVPSGCQTQLIGVPQLGCAQPLAVPTPVILAPQVCAPVQPCAPVQSCPRQPVPPPVQMAPQQPGRPGHPHK